MNEPLGVVIVGCAHTPHALSYARVLGASARVNLVGVWDADAELAARVAQRGGTSTWPAAEALVADPAVDAVVVAGVTAEHRSITELAAAHGRHVLCEKPIATTAADAAAMVDVCSAAGVQLHTAFVTRFYPIVQSVRSVIARGALGDLVGMVGGNRGRPPLPPAYPAWITSPAEAGGGAMIDHSVHVTDVMRHVTGREVLSVHAEVDHGLWDTAVDDTALMLLTLEGGLVASIDPSWSIPQNSPADYDFYLHVVGTEGALTITDTMEAISLVAPAVRPGMVSVPFGVDIDAAMIDCFVDSVRAGEPVAPAATGVDGWRALEVALAGYRSAAARQAVAVALDR